MVSCCCKKQKQKGMVIRMKRVIEDIKKYRHYTKYAAKSELKAEVAGSHLNWLWWFLDPILFMLVYSFISLVVFGKGEKYFPVFVFIGLSVWNFFNKTIISSVKIVSANSSIVSKVYIPKYFLIVKNMLINGFKMLISFGLVICMMIGYRVEVSWKILWMFPLLIILFVIVFGVSTIVAHFGVFVEDLSNLLQVFLRMMFYLSGVFYSLEGRLHAPYNKWMLNLNPTAYLMGSLRKVMLYNTMPNLYVMLFWFVIGLILSWVGIRIIYKYENSYVKVI